MQRSNNPSALDRFQYASSAFVLRAIFGVSVAFVVLATALAPQQVGLIRYAIVTATGALAAVGLMMLRRRNLEAALWIATSSLVLPLAALLMLIGVVKGNAALLALVLPLAMAALTRSRAALYGLAGILALALVLAAAVERKQWIAPLPELQPQLVLVLVLLSLAMVTAFLDQFTLRHREVLQALEGELSVRSRAEAQQRASDARFQLIAEHSADTLALIDARGLFRYLSPSFLEETGFAPHALLGTSTFAQVHPEDLLQAQAAFARCSVEGHAELSVRQRLAAGGYGWFELRSARVELDGEELILTVGRNVEERRSLQEQAANADRLEGLGRLAGGVAHDFKNYLSVVLSSAGLAREACAPGHPALEELDAIELACQRGTTLVQQLITFSRPGEAELRAVELNGAIADLGPVLRRMVPAHVTFVLEPCFASCPVVADVTQLEQVATNLVVNAAHAMGAHRGSITLSTRVTSLVGARAQRAGVRPGAYAELCVRDEGVGMTPAVSARIFEPFFTTKGAAGSGLGLATSAAILRHHGGAINVESTPGQGTTMRVLLPTSAQPTPLELPSATARASLIASETAELPPRALS